jgi:signal transduction histidine kinase
VIIMLRDVSELRRMQTDLAASHSDLQRLVSQLDRAQEDERRRIARELHDDLQQKLAAIAMNVSAAGAQLQRDPQRAAAALAAADEQAASAIESTRRIVNDLRPQLLDDLGLVAALEALCEHFTQTSGIACRVLARPAARQRAAAAPHLATCLYRVAQESLNNVAKHTRASQVRVELEADADQRLTLRVRDNGAGMSPGARRKPGSFGLLGMSERLRIFDGTLRIDSSAGRGTTVEASLPCAAPVVAA